MTVPTTRVYTWDVKVTEKPKIQRTTDSNSPKHLVTASLAFEDASLSSFFFLSLKFRSITNVKIIRNRHYAMLPLRSSIGNENMIHGDVS